MNARGKMFLAVGLGGLWISLSEFLRNEILLKHLWVDHYANLGMTFPSQPLNGALWVLWSLLLALAVFWLNRRFSMVQTALLAWFCGFVLMWVVIGNLGVLPPAVLAAAVPWSLAEVLLAAWIVRRCV